MNLDWQRIVLNIRSAGLSFRAQSRRVGADKDTLGKFARGEIEEPRFSVGLALLNLHHDVCPEKHKLENLRIGAR